MSASATVIERFLTDVVRGLREREADGAAERTWAASAIFEPRGRAGVTADEQRRLLLLADRAVHRWVPATVAAIRDDGLVEVARQQQAVREQRDAAEAAQRLGALRDLLRRLPSGPRPVNPDQVATALASLQLMLRHIANGEPSRPDMTAATAVSYGARGLIACYFDVGAYFADGMPGEVRETVTVLDSLGADQTVSWGAPPNERTPTESDLHRTLVQSLMSTLSRDGGEITHAANSSTLPAPPRVGRHRPEFAGRTLTGGLFLGEAKIGPELFDDYTQEQFADFLAFQPDGERVALHLNVPAGWRSEATRAAREAAGSVDTLVVHEVAGLRDAPEPSRAD